MNSFLRSFTFVVIAAHGVVGCGSYYGSEDTSAKSRGSLSKEPHHACDNRSIESTCADYPESTTANEAASSCDGTMISADCPHEQSVGTCYVVTANGTSTNTYYSDGPKPHTEAEARETCTRTFGGVFDTL